MTAAPRRRLIKIAYLFGGLLLVSSVAGAGWMMRTYAGPPTSSPSSSAATVKPVFGLGHVDVEGGVSFPYATISGRVVDVPVREGQAVKKGDVLFRLDDYFAQQDLQSAERAVKLAEMQFDTLAIGREELKVQKRQLAAGIKAKQLEIDAARFKAQRARAMAGQAGYSHEEAAAAEKGVQALEATLALPVIQNEQLDLKGKEIDEKERQARLDVEQKKQLVEKARRALDEYTVKATADGAVLRLTLQVGDLLSGPPKTPPLIFCPATPRVVRLEVEQEWAHLIREGMTALIEDYTSNGDGPKWEGKVTRVADWMAPRRSVLPDPSQFYDVRTLECIVSIETSEKAPLRIGQRVRVTLPKPNN